MSSFLFQNYVVFEFFSLVFKLKFNFDSIISRHNILRSLHLQIKFVGDLRQIGVFLVSSTNEADFCDIQVTEILLKVALNTTTVTPTLFKLKFLQLWIIKHLHVVKTKWALTEDDKLLECYQRTMTDTK